RTRGDPRALELDLNPSPSREPWETADADLSARMLRGFYTYLVLLSILAVTTDCFYEHPRIAWSATAMIVSGLLIRITLIAGRRHFVRQDPRRWQTLMGVTVVMIASSCGCLHAAFGVMYGLESWPFLISAIWVAGLASGGCITLVPNITFVCLHLFAIEGPVILMSVWIGGARG